MKLVCMSCNFVDHKNSLPKLTSFRCKNQMLGLFLITLSVRSLAWAAAVVLAESRRCCCSLTAFPAGRTSALFLRSFSRSSSRSLVRRSSSSCFCSSAVCLRSIWCQGHLIRNTPFGLERINDHPVLTNVIKFSNVSCVLKIMPVPPPSPAERGLCAWS